MLTLFTTAAMASTFVVLGGDKTLISAAVPLTTTALLDTPQTTIFAQQPTSNIFDAVS